MSETIIKRLLLVFFGSYSLIMLALAGYGLNGKYLMLFGILISIYCCIDLYRLRKYISKILSNSFFLGAKFYIIISIFLYWYTIADYYLIELLKKLDFNTSDNTYWKVVFGGLIPTTLVLQALWYFGSNGQRANTLKIIIASAFLINSNINDLLYYVIFGDELPLAWQWLHQPQYLFGLVVNTDQVLMWALICIAFSVVTFITPFESLTGEDLNNNQKPSTSQINQLLIYLCTALLLISFSFPTIDAINQSLNKTTPYRKISNADVNKNDININPTTPQEAARKRLALVDKIVSYLDAYYSINKSYPLSTSNCQANWDSSEIGLPFQLESTEIRDPEQSDGGECFIEANNKSIIYYSDGSRFALVADGNTIENETPYLYNSEYNDVRWFDSEIQFARDWKWNNKLIVHQYQDGKDITTFVNK